MRAGHCQNCPVKTFVLSSRHVKEKVTSSLISLLSSTSAPLFSPLSLLKVRSVCLNVERCTLRNCR